MRLKQSAIVLLLLGCMCHFAKAQFGMHTEKSISLRLGYSIHISRSPDCTTGLSFKLERNGKELCADTEEVVQDSLYPMVLHFGTHDEVLVRLENAPSKDIAVRYFIENNSVVRHDTLPAFESSPLRLRTDGLPSFVTRWDYAQEPDENHRDYAPTIFYVLTPDGLILDSVMTRSINKKIYGRFCGFYINEKLLFPASKVDPAEAKAFKVLNRARPATLGGY